MTTLKNFGLKLDEPSSEHYVFGSTGSVPMEVLQEDRNWTSYITEHEIQNLNGIEPYACVIFTTLRCVEILINKKYGETRDYSKRFLATIVDTSQGGTSPQLAAETLRLFGVTNETDWPFDATIDSNAKFFAQIPQTIKDLAKEFVQEWDFKHDFVIPNTISITSALECSPLLFSWAAWFMNDKGLYYKPTGMPDNHAVVLVKILPEAWQIYDSYLDGIGNQSLKELDIDQMPMVVKRFWIEKKSQKKESSNFWQKVWLWLIKLLKI